MKFSTVQNVVEDLNGKRIFKDEAVVLPLSVPFRVIALQFDWIHACYPVACITVGRKSFNALVLQFISESAEECRSGDDLIRKFADFVESLTGADTLSQFKAMVDLECRIEMLPSEVPEPTGWLPFLLQWFRQTASRSFQMAANAHLIRSRHGEVALWLYQQAHYCSLQTRPPHKSYMTDRQLLGVFPVGHGNTKAEQSDSEFWVLQKLSSGIALTPIDSAQFAFYSRLQCGMTLSTASESYSLQKIQSWLAPALHQGLFRLAGAI